MAFVSIIVVVDDVLKSRAFFEKVFDLKVDDDFGSNNVGFKGGLALYDKIFFKKLTNNITITNKSNNFVLYFEVDNIESIEKEVKSFNFEFIHEIKEQPWGQREFRFYDYDDNIIEVAENMNIVIFRMQNMGKNIEEISKKTGYKEKQISEILGKRV